MLSPKKTKYRKQQKGKIKGVAQRGNQLAFGTFGIKTMDTGRLTSRQIEAARIAVTRFMKREGQVWIRIFPDTPITKKPAEVRMGKGKGALDHWVAKIEPADPNRGEIELLEYDQNFKKESSRLACQITLGPEHDGLIAHLITNK